MKYRAGERRPAVEEWQGLIGKRLTSDNGTRYTAKGIREMFET